MEQKGFGRLIVIIVVGILLLFGFRIVSEHFLGINPIKLPSFPKKEDIPAKKNNELFQGMSREEGCKSGDIPKFDAKFTDLEKLNALGQIGGITGGSPGRSYMGVKKGMEAPIYAPTDAVLENIIYARRGGPSTPGEYGLYIRVSCNVTILFDHIDKISDRLKEKAPKEPAETSRTEFDPVNLEIKKGELLGYSDGTPQARTFDFLLIDRSKPATHINPKRWEWEQAVYSQCPYDYFIDELRQEYYQKIGEIGEKSGVLEFYPAQNCGTLAHDIKGTISGGWFKGESTDIKGDYLAIAKVGERVDIAQRKDGDFKDGIGSGESKLRDYSPKLSPEDVKVGQEICYYDQSQNRWAYVKLISEAKLSFARGTGNCPTGFPQSLSEFWER